jgi:hypothetical protein
MIPRLRVGSGAEKKNSPYSMHIGADYSQGIIGWEHLVRLGLACLFRIPIRVPVPTCVDQAHEDV